jgi:hypothetical protein
MHTIRPQPPAGTAWDTPTTRSATLSGPPTTSRWRSGSSAKYGDRHGQAHALIHLGDALFAAEEESSAREVWQQSLSILDDMNHPGAEPVRANLRQLDARDGLSPGVRA